MDHQAVSRLLCSDKVSYRKRGKEELENILKYDVNFHLISNRNWWDILWSTLQWEEKEIHNHNQKKGLQKNHLMYMNALFVKQVFRHGTCFATFTDIRVQQVICHLLSVLHDKHMDFRYKDEHKELLAELLLNARFSFFVSEEDILGIINYMKQTIDEKIISHRFNSKLLKAVPSCLYHDFQNSTLLEIVFDWYISLVSNAVVDDSDNYNAAVSACAELFTSTIDFHDANCSTLLFSRVDTLLQKLSRVLAPSSSYNRESVLTFLVRFSDISRGIGQAPRLYRSQTASLKNIYDALTCDEMLTPLLFSNQHVLKSTRDPSIRSDINPLFDDPKIRLHFDAAVAVGILLYESNYDGTTDVTQSSPLDSLIVRFEGAFDQMGVRLQHTALKSPAVHASRAAASPTTYKSGIQRLAAMSMLLCRFTQNTSNWSCTIFSSSGPDRSTVCKDGTYDAECLDTALLSGLSNCLRAALDHIKMATSLDQQFEATLVWCLAEFINVVGQAFVPSGNASDAHDSKSKNMLWSCWQSIIDIVVDKVEPFNQKKLSQNSAPTGACSPWKAQIVDGSVVFMKRVLEGKILRSWGGSSQLVSRLWETVPFIDPTGCDSPHIFSLMAAMLEISGCDVPDGLGERYQGYRLQASIDFTGELDFLCADENYFAFPLLRVVKYILVWAEGLRDNSIVLNVGVRHLRWSYLCRDINETISRIILKLFGSSKAYSPTVQSSVGQAQLSFGIKYWLCTKASGFSSLLRDTPIYARRACAMVTDYGFIEPIDSKGLRDCFDTGGYTNKRPLSACLSRMLLSYANLLVHSTPPDEKTDGALPWAIPSVLTVSLLSSFIDVVYDIGVDIVPFIEAAWTLSKTIVNVTSVKRSKGLIKEIDCEDIFHYFDSSLISLSRSSKVCLIVPDARNCCYDNVLDIVKTIKTEASALNQNFSRDPEKISSDHNDFELDVRCSQSKPTKTRFDEEDAFMDSALDSSLSGDNVVFSVCLQAVSASMPRLVLSPEQLRLLVFCCRFLVCSQPNGQTIEAIHEMLSFVDDRAKKKIENCIHVPSEFWLLLAEHLAEVYATRDTFSLILNSWDKDWAGLGFCKVLQVLHCLMQAPEFFALSKSTGTSPPNEDLVSDCADIVFAEHSSIKDFPVHLSRIRTLQMACIKYIFRTNPVLYKEKYAKFMLAGLTDRDFRTRLIAAATIDSLFLSFRKNHFAIYRSMVSGMAKWLHESETFETIDQKMATQFDWVLKIATSCIALLGIACNGVNLICIAMRDIVVLCSMLPLKKCDVSGKIDGAFRSPLKIMLLRCMDEISLHHGYADISRLFGDHVRPLLYDWLSSTKSQLLLSGPYDLENFPYYLCGALSLNSFVRDSASFFVPTVCEISPPERRWVLLQQVSALYGVGSHDSGIARLLLDFSPHVQAMIYFRRFNSINLTEHCGSYTDRSAYIRSFVSRVVDASELKKRICAEISSTFLNFLMMPLYYSDELTSVDAGENGLAEYNACFLSDIAKSVSDMLRISKNPAAIWDINSADLVASLISRLFEANLESTFTRICEVVIIIFEIYLPMKKSGSLLNFGRALWSSQHSSGEFLLLFYQISSMILKYPSKVSPVLGLKVVNHFVDCLLENINESDVSVEALGHAGTVFCSIFCDSLLCLREIFSKINTKSDSLRHEEPIAAYRMYDSLIFCKFKTQLPEESMLQLDRIASESIKWCRQHCSQFPDILRLALMAPRGDEIAGSTALRCELSLLEENLISVSTVAAIECLTKFASCVRWGIPSSMSVLSLALSGFIDLVQNNSHQCCSIWSCLTVETMRMVMALSRLTQDGRGTGMQYFRYNVMHFLGKLGAPHLQKLGHADLSMNFNPFRGDFALYDASDPNLVKFRIYLKIFQHLLEPNPQRIRIGRHAIHLLEKSNCINELIVAHENLVGRVYSSFLFNHCDNICSHDDSSFEKLFSCEKGTDSVWDARGKNFDTWVCRLTSLLLFCCKKAHDGSAHGRFLQELVVNSDLSFLDDVVLADPFLRSITDICCISPDICEMALPMIFSSILEEGVHSELSFVRQSLSSKVEQFLLSADPSLDDRVRRLGCYCVWFRMRQEMNYFLRPSSIPRCAPKQGLSKKRKFQKVEPNDLPFSYGYDINIMKIISAAISCGSCCTASLFFEYFWNQFGEFSIKKQLALEIAQGLHDADAIYNVCNDLPSLETQGIMYAHADKWGEALLTYESMLRFRFGQHPSLENNICDALTNMGYDAVLNDSGSADSFMRTASEIGIKALRNLHEWGVPGSAHRKTISSTDEVVHLTTLCIKDMKRGEVEATVERIRNCYERNIHPRFSLHSGDETAIRFVQELSKLQMLTEIEEVSGVRICHTGQNDLLSHQRVDAVLEKWRGRMESMRRSLSVGQQLMRHRLNLVQALLQENKISALQGVDFMDHFNELLVGPGAAHSLSPLWYDLKSTLKRVLSCNPVTDIVDIECSLNESRLMWSKGLCDMAFSCLSDAVIAPLNTIRGSTTGISRSAVATVMSTVSNDIFKDPLITSRINGDLSDALLLCGEFVLSKKCTRGNIDIAAYFKSALEVAEQQTQKIKAYDSLGSFNYHVYQNLKARVDSTEWQQSKKLVADRQEELQHCIQDLKIFTANLPRSRTEEHLTEHRNRSRHIRTLQKEIEMDAKERDATESQVEAVLLESLSNYGAVLSLSRDANLSAVFRIISLWFDNASKGPVNDLIRHIFQSVSTFKFVPLTYQIFSRAKSDLSSNNDGDSMRGSLFSKAICDLILRLCTDHPHHTLPQLLAMVKDSPNNLKSSSRPESSITIASPVAKILLAQLAKISSALGRMITLTSSLMDEYIRIAFFPVDAMVKSNKISNIPFSEIAGSAQSNPFNKFFQLIHQNVGGSCADESGQRLIGSDGSPAVLTWSLPLREDCDYRSIVRAIRFKSTFSITETGLSRPKIITCEGSDGILYKQLVKGGDDMRQDAVMEQVFEHVNAMLQKDENTQSRHLCIRTYKIIPLMPQAGVVEWVNNTVQFGHYLTDRLKGAHGRYYPDDLSHSECRKLMTDNVKENPGAAGTNTIEYKGPQQKEDVFRGICSRFRPVFRYFFLENYSDPVTWMTRRTAYTRSVAASSMVGYILGIGDRHSQNILVDVLTAEVVHIDFGIMFEQGKVLGTPETVPFRLTRDIVDGMGVSGCEGTYRRCCEEVLRVLRENFAQILTILEVVIHDPLYKWTLSPLQARKKQTREYENLSGESAAAALVLNCTQSLSSSSTDAAKRTLLRIKNKLQGSDDPTGDILSVKGQVSMLINEATSEANLCRLFAGWAPWL